MILNRFIAPLLLGLHLAPAHAYVCDTPIDYAKIFKQSSWVAQARVLEISGTLDIPEWDKKLYDVVVAPTHFYKGALRDSTTVTVTFQHAPKVGEMYHLYVYESKPPSDASSNKTWRRYFAGGSCLEGDIPLLNDSNSKAPGNAYLAKHYGYVYTPNHDPVLFAGKAGLVISYGGKHTAEHQKAIASISANVSTVIKERGYSRVLPPAKWTDRWGWAIQVNDLPAGRYAVTATLPYEYFGNLDDNTRRWRYSHEIKVTNKNTNGGNCGVNPMLNDVGANRICDSTAYYIELVEGETRTAELRKLPNKPKP